MLLRRTNSRVDAEKINELLTSHGPCLQAEVVAFLRLWWWWWWWCRSGGGAGHPAVAVRGHGDGQRHSCSGADAEARYSEGRG